MVRKHQASKDMGSAGAWPTPLLSPRGRASLPRCVVMFDAAERAVALARGDASLRIALFEQEWASVDRVRDHAASAGVQDRVAVRQVGSLRAAGLSAWPCGLLASAAGTRDAFN